MKERAQGGREGRRHKLCCTDLPNTLMTMTTEQLLLTDSILKNWDRDGKSKMYAVAQFHFFEDHQRYLLFFLLLNYK